MNNGWIKLYKKIGDHVIMGDLPALGVFIWVLTHVNNEGQVTVSRYVTSESLRMKPSTFRDVLKRLQNKYQVVVLNPTTTHTTIRLLNWAKYQARFTETDIKPTTTRQRHDNDTTLYKEYKNKEIRNNIYTPLQEYLSAFNEKFGKHYEPTKGRELKLKLRLKRYALEQILQALDGLSQSKFHRGENDRGWQADPDFLIRSDEQIDKFLNLGKAVVLPKSSLLDLVEKAKGGTYA